MLSLIHFDCTFILNVAIADQRKRYAAERDDFHSYFEFKTVSDIQKTLRSRKSDREAVEERVWVVRDLLRAQQQSPHRLWTLLLIQAFEPLLVRRRCMISTDSDVALDNVVIESFIDALADIPEHLEVEELRHHVIETSRHKLTRAMRGDWRGSLLGLTKPMLLTELGITENMAANDGSTIGVPRHSGRHLRVVRVCSARRRVR